MKKNAEVFEKFCEYLDSLEEEDFLGIEDMSEMFDNNKYSFLFLDAEKEQDIKKKAEEYFGKSKKIVTKKAFILHVQNT